MFSDIKEPLLYSLLPVGASLLGAFFASLFVPRPKLIAFFFHIAAGMILTSGTLEFLPHLTESGEKIRIATSFLAGGVVMILLHMLFLQLERWSALTMTLALSIALLVQGMILAVGFYISKETGIFLTFSLLLLALLLNFVVMHTVYQRRWRGIVQGMITFFVALMYPLGLWIGNYLLSTQYFTKVEVIAFTAALFLYLGFHELLRGARSPKEGWFYALALFIGLLLPLILV